MARRGARDLPDNRGLPWAARLKASVPHHKFVKTPNSLHNDITTKKKAFAENDHFSTRLPIVF